VRRWIHRYNTHGNSMIQPQPYPVGAAQQPE
jgi:hypothetical protein